MTQSTVQTTSPKLNELFIEITTAVESVAEVMKRSPRDIINVAKTIEKGEKRIQKEFAKRIDEAKAIQNELEAIREFALKMGYSFLETDPDTNPLEETEPTPEPEQQGIKITIGNAGEEQHHDPNE